MFMWIVLVAVRHATTKVQSMHPLRIATYTLWASDVQFTERLDAACAKITRIDADIVALQEARTSVPQDTSINAATYIQRAAGYPHAIMRPYAIAVSEGFAYLSKHPLSAVKPPSGDGNSVVSRQALRVRVNLGSACIALTNVHLDHKQIGTREDQVVEMSQWIKLTGRPPAARAAGGLFCEHMYTVAAAHCTRWWRRTSAPASRTTIDTPSRIHYAALPAS